MSAEPIRTSGGDSNPSAPFVLLLYGEEYTNLALADELTLDGYEVRRASDPAKLRAACDAGKIALVIFGRASRRGAGPRRAAPAARGRVRARGQAGPAHAMDEPERRARRRAARIRGRRRRCAPRALRLPRASCPRSSTRPPRPHRPARRDRVRELRIDTAAHEVTVGATPVVGLRRLEYALLVHLARDPARVYTKDELLREVWGIRSLA